MARVRGFPARIFSGPADLPGLYRRDLARELLPDFFPVRTAVALLSAARRLTPPDQPFWKAPPYEYENTIAPIDILSGSADLRESIDAGTEVGDIWSRWEPWEDAWRVERLADLLYTGKPGF